MNLEYKGYSIPEHLIRMTGGPPEKWEQVITSHFNQYKRFCPMAAGMNVVEIGCGIGRDAIPLIEILTESGSYLGVDVIRDSIQWCTENITSRHPNFTFVWYDIYSQGYNPEGTMKTKEISLPIDDDSIDRFILQSVFTHLFEEDITHYMREFQRGLRDDGLVLASCFIVDDETYEMAQEHSRYTFQHPHEDGFRINDPTCPERAVSFREEALDRMLEASGLELAIPIQRGKWCGRNAGHFQDILILRTKK